MKSATASMIYQTGTAIKGLLGLLVDAQIKTSEILNVKPVECLINARYEVVKA